MSFQRINWPAIAQETHSIREFFMLLPPDNQVMTGVIRGFPHLILPTEKVFRFSLREIVRAAYSIQAADDPSESPADRLRFVRQFWDHAIRHFQIPTLHYHYAVVPGPNHLLIAADDPPLHRLPDEVACQLQTVFPRPPLGTAVMLRGTRMVVVGCCETELCVELARADHVNID